MSANPFSEESETEPTNEEATQRELCYSNAEEWVNNWLLPHYRRNPATHKWDPQWWRYEEVGTLMETLWETWEKMRWDGAGGIAAYFRDYLYPLMDRITAPDGPFWNYDPPLKEDVPPTLPSGPAPEGWYD